MQTIIFAELIILMNTENHICKIISINNLTQPTMTLRLWRRMNQKYTYRSITLLLFLIQKYKKNTVQHASEFIFTTIEVMHRHAILES